MNVKIISAVMLLLAVLGLSGLALGVDSNSTGSTKSITVQKREALMSANAELRAQILAALLAGTKKKEFIRQANIDRVIQIKSIDQNTKSDINAIKTSMKGQIKTVMDEAKAMMHDSNSTMTNKEIMKETKSEIKDIRSEAKDQIKQVKRTGKVAKVLVKANVEEIKRLIRATWKQVRDTNKHDTNSI